MTDRYEFRASRSHFSPRIQFSYKYVFYACMWYAYVCGTYLCMWYVCMRYMSLTLEHVRNEKIRGRLNNFSNPALGFLNSRFGQFLSI